MDNYKTINEDELADFRNICSDSGYSADEFKFNEHSVTLPDKVGPLYGKVTISRNGKSKTYKTGNGSSWPADFDEDLRNKFFI